MKTKYLIFRVNSLPFFPDLPVRLTGWVSLLSLNGIKESLSEWVFSEGAGARGGGGWERWWCGQCGGGYGPRKNGGLKRKDGK